MRGVVLVPSGVLALALSAACSSATNVDEPSNLVDGGAHRATDAALRDAGTRAADGAAHGDADDDVGTVTPDAHIMAVDAGASGSDAASTSGQASVTGSVGGVSLVPAYAYSQVLSGDLFVLISNDADPCGGSGAEVLAFQTIGGHGVGTYMSGTSLLVSLFSGAGTCGGGVVVGTGTLTVGSESQAVEGSFSATFNGATLSGSFTAPAGTGCGHLPSCDGG